jgi:hypothetical protein
MVCGPRRGFGVLCLTLRLADTGKWEKEDSEDKDRATPTSECLYLSLGVTTILSGFGLYTGMCVGAVGSPLTMYPF